MPPVVWTEDAVDDINRLESFLDRKSPEAAVRAILAIHEVADQLERFPGSGRPAEGRPPDERELIVPFGTGGYMVLYRSEADLVLILAVRHMREAGY